MCGDTRCVLAGGLRAKVAVPFTARLQRAVTHAGAIDPDAAMPLAALVMYRLKSDDLAARLFAGEILTLALDDRDVAVGVAH